MSANNATATRHREDSLYVCLDQGGHASRALVFDGRGQMHAEAFVDIATIRRNVEVEHDPEELLRSLHDALTKVASILGTAATRITAAGLATQRSSIVCWERSSGKALSPVISWQDTRARDWLDAYKQYEPRIHRITGLVLSPHYGVSKLHWCLANLPDVQAARERGDLVFGPLAAFLAQRLTGSEAPCADPANASRTLLWDRNTRNWSVELLELFGIPQECLPAAVASRATWGELTVGAVQIPLTVVTGDQSAALFAFGEPEPATVYANLGTGAFLQRSCPGGIDESGRLLASIVYQDPRRSVQVIEGTVNGAGSAITAIAGELAITQQHIEAEASIWLEKFSADLLFLNAVSGLGSPWWRADTESHFVGAAAETAAAADKLAAVMESIVFLLVVNLLELNRLTNRPARLLVTGGLAAIDPLLQRLANLAQLPVERAVGQEATARGLACLLADVPADWPSAEIDKLFMPATDLALLQRYQQWHKLMPGW